jgi:hypothetical protein
MYYNFRWTGRILGIKDSGKRILELRKDRQWSQPELPE